MGVAEDVACPGWSFQELKLLQKGDEIALVVVPAADGCGRCNCLPWLDECFQVHTFTFLKQFFSRYTYGFQAHDCLTEAGAEG